MPELGLLQLPREPWRPAYWRDTGSLAGSLLLALLAMCLVEFSTGQSG